MNHEPVIVQIRRDYLVHVLTQLCPDMTLEKLNAILKRLGFGEWLP